MIQYFYWLLKYKVLSIIFSVRNRGTINSTNHHNSQGRICPIQSVLYWLSNNFDYSHTHKIDLSLSLRMLCIITWLRTWKYNFHALDWPYQMKMHSYSTFLADLCRLLVLWITQIEQIKSNYSDSIKCAPQRDFVLSPKDNTTIQWNCWMRIQGFTVHV